MCLRDIGLYYIKGHIYPFIYSIPFYVKNVNLFDKYAAIDRPECRLRQRRLGH